MPIRSPRKLALLSFITFIFIVLILPRSPWEAPISYHRISLFRHRYGTTNRPRPPWESVQHGSLVDGVVDEGYVAFEAFEDGEGDGDGEDTEDGGDKDKDKITSMSTDEEGAGDGDENEDEGGDATEKEEGYKKKAKTWGEKKAQRLQEYMKEMLDWNRPGWDGHWPPFGDYEDKGYDPNRWEAFPNEEGFYRAGVDRLGKFGGDGEGGDGGDEEGIQEGEAYRPFPEYNSEAWRKEWEGEFVACKGARGILLNESRDDEVRVHKGVPEGFPKVYAGSYDVVGLDGDVCFERWGRYGAYGFGRSWEDKEAEDRDGGVHDIEGWKYPDTTPDWMDVKWGELQDECVRANEKRWRPEARVGIEKQPSIDQPVPEANDKEQKEEKDTDTKDRNKRGTNNPKDEKKHHPRTAILIRAWTGYHYHANDILSIRAMITELSLQSGGEYSVYLFVHVKGASNDIFRDPILYSHILNEHVPPELQDIAILWSESIFPSWYPDVGDWQVYWQQFMCLQWFSLTHPEFEYIWNWETDARYIGHHYHFFSKIAEFADQQPRKLLWERNKRFYIPSIHGNYTSFIENTHTEILKATTHNQIPPPIWGPRPWPQAAPPQIPLGPEPPTTFEEDDFSWGVSEPADLITLLPIWDPRNTSWSYKDKIWNYIPSVAPQFTDADRAQDWFTHPAFHGIERRVFINTVVRFSARMLRAMHEENRVGRSMAAEMWPASVALQHGLKAVYAPHPIFSDKGWDSQYSAAIFDSSCSVDGKGGARECERGKWTEGEDSPYNHDREYNFMGWSWYFASKFPRRLYRRWLGWETEAQDWGEDVRVVGGGGSDGEGQGRRMCVPGVLLHPVKGMERGRVGL